MSEEYDNDNITFSPFWPILILLIGLIAWFGYQLYTTNQQRSAYNAQFQAAVPTISQAQEVRDRYVALVKDLIDTSVKDTYAKQIVQEAQQANMIRITPNTPSGDASAPSSDAAPAAPSATPPAAPSN